MRSIQSKWLIEELQDLTLLGHFFENLVVADILKKNHHQYQLKEYWFWRDSNNHEVDLLTKKGLQFDVFEIKSTQTILPKLFKGLNYFSEVSSKVNRSTLVYGGKEDQDRTNHFIRTWETAI